MCEPVTIAAVAAAVAAVASVGGTTASAVSQQQAGKAKNRLSEQNTQLQNAQIARGQSEEAEARSQKAFELSRQFVAAKGEAQNAGLGDRSVRAIGRSLGFQLGQDKATLDRNAEISATQAGARLRGIQLSRTSDQLAIGDTSGALLGLQIGTGLIDGAVKGVGIADSLGAFSNRSAPDTTSTRPQPTAAELGFPAPA